MGVTVGVVVMVRVRVVVMVVMVVRVAVLSLNGGRELRHLPPVVVVPPEEDLRGRERGEREGRRRRVGSR